MPNETFSSEDIDYLASRRGLQLFFTICLLLAAVLGIAGNILVILAVMISKTLRKPCNMFIVNLAIADTMITTVVDPFNVFGAYVGRSFFEENNTLCEIIASLCAPACLCSMFSICAISINRYVMICHFHSYAKIYTWKNTLLMCTGLWLISYFIHLPNHVGWGTNAFDPAYYICTFSIATYSYALFYVILGVFVPLVIVLFAYISIFYHYWSTKHKLRQRRSGLKMQKMDLSNDFSSQFPATESGSPSFGLLSRESERRNSPAHRERKTFLQEDFKLAKTLFTVFIAFLFCWTPFAVLVLMGQPKEVPGWVYMVAIILAHGNSSINSLLYGITNEKFRSAYWSVVGIEGSPTAQKDFAKKYQMTNPVQSVTNPSYRPLETAQQSIVNGSVPSDQSSISCPILILIDQGSQPGESNIQNSLFKETLV